MVRFVERRGSHEIDAFLAKPMDRCVRPRGVVGRHGETMNGRTFHASGGLWEDLRTRPRRLDAFRAFKVHWPTQSGARVTALQNAAAVAGVTQSREASWSACGLPPLSLGEWPANVVEQGACPPDCPKRCQGHRTPKRCRGGGCHTKSRSVLECARLAAAFVG